MFRSKRSPSSQMRRCPYAYVCIDSIDSGGVERRKRLKRGKYSTPGPNVLWHVDGMNKLAHLDIFIP